MISFGKALLSDALRISVLYKTVYIQTYGAEGITFESASFITKRFSNEQIEKTIMGTSNELIVACHNGNPIGVAEVIVKTVCPIRQISTAELDKLYVLQSYYGKGIGYGLLNESEKLCLEYGIAQMNIEVYIENERAITFYKRQGYNLIGKVDFPMESNVYENLVLNKRLK